MKVEELGNAWARGFFREAQYPQDFIDSRGIELRATDP